MTSQQVNQCRRILQNYGADHQIKKAVEEFGELLTELGRYLNGAKNEDKIVDEIADATIMCEQLSFVFGPISSCMRVDYKIRRQLERIKTANGDRYDA